MKKIILGLLGAGIAIGGYYYSMQGSTPNNLNSENTELALTEKYTLEEIAIHDNKDDCWLLLDGKIYDVTPYITSGFHPGKEAILMGCGKDATSLFNNRPNGSGSHSDRARSMLSKYYKGELAQ